ncbi:MAG: hypothetical protein J4F42_15875 [Desulfurellaceae bacterium]|nr:hypothetical protein [Desulfurellaceae bacterium]
MITGKKSVEWLPDSETRPDQIQLNLHNAQAGALVDSPKSWPDKIELRGFTYRQLGGPMQEDDPSERPVDDFLEWLSRNEIFSFQPYQQLATVLSDAGKSNTANAVLFAVKERERRSATGWRRVGLSILQYGIGYGIGVYTFRVLWWAISVVLFGWGVLCIWEEPQNHWEPIGFWFSLDYLLPIIRLRDTHYETVNLSSVVRLYFYIHQIIGYVLASLLIAALSGIIRAEE